MCFPSVRASTKTHKSTCSRSFYCCYFGKKGNFFSTFIFFGIGLIAYFRKKTLHLQSKLGICFYSDLWQCSM